MNKNYILTFALIFGFIILWQSFMNKIAPKQTASVENLTQLGSIPGQVDIRESLPSEISPLSLEDSFPEVEIGSYRISYSPKGGFIKKLTYIPYGDDLIYENIGLIPGQENTPFRTQLKFDRIVFKGPEDFQKEFIFNGTLLDIVTNAPSASLLLFSSYESKGLDQRYQEFFFSQNQIMERKPFRKVKDTKSPAVNFAGSRDRYYCLSLLPAEYDLRLVGVNKQAFLYLLKPEASVSIYVGPQKVSDLQPLELESVVNYGFFNAVALVIIKLLHFFFALTKSWGISVILFSIVAYVVLFPLTFKGSKGMKEMQDFQRIHKEEINQIKAKYVNEPNKIHQATMEMYKKHGFNPLKGCSSGCLPMLVQIPLIWAFWAVAPRAWEFKGSSFLWIKDLSLPDHTIHFSTSLPLLGEWLNILPLLTSVVMYLQMKYTSPNMDPEQAQQQKIMGLIFPVMIAFFFYSFPSALLLYWGTNSALTFLSQMTIMKAKKH